MRIEDRIILELCKKNKKSEEIIQLLNSKQFKLEYFLTMIEKHLIKSYVLNELLNYEIPPIFFKILKNIAKESILETTLFNRLLSNEMKIILNELNKYNIDAILMKGLSIDKSGLRNNRDIDILIRQKDLISSIDILKNINYQYIGNKINHKLNRKERTNIESQLSWNNQFQLINKSNNIMLELHTNLFERGRAYGINLNTLLDNIDDFWHRKVWNDSIKAYTFSNEDIFLLMCMQNGIKKSLSSNMFVLRTMIDLQNLIEIGIDWNNIINLAKHYDISSFVYFSLHLLDKILKFNISDETLDHIRKNCTNKQLFIENIHLRCYQSLNRSSIFFSNIYKIISPYIYKASLKHKIKHSFLIPILFPPRWRIAQLYHLKKNNPAIYLFYFINPLRWIFIIIKNILRK